MVKASRPAASQLTARPSTRTEKAESVRPKASATPAKPMPSSGKPAARTALPQPPKTSQNVPMASAKSFFCITFLPPWAVNRSCKGTPGRRQVNWKLQVRLRPTYAAGARGCRGHLFRRGKARRNEKRPGEPDLFRVPRTYWHVRDEFGAQERTRTSTPFRALAPEASASTNSATWAVRRACKERLPACQRGFSKPSAYVQNRPSQMPVQGLLRPGRRVFRKPLAVRRRESVRRRQDAAPSRKIRNPVVRRPA